jgi:hypothetical protein
VAGTDHDGVVVGHGHAFILVPPQGRAANVRL